MKLSHVAKIRVLCSIGWAALFALAGYLLAYKWANYTDAGHMACTAQGFCTELWRRMTAHDRLITFLYVAVSGAASVAIYHLLTFAGGWFYRRSKAGKALQAIIDGTKESAHA